jgi:Cd2+/Zn2+-exporting ATPase
MAECYVEPNAQENAKTELPWWKWARLGAGTAILIIVLLFSPPGALAWYGASYLLIGGGVLLRAVRNITAGQVLDEHFLMTIASVGAFAIGHYPEAVAVMLFYQIGEQFEDAAVDRSRRSIQALLDIKPDYANLRQGQDIVQVDPAQVAVGDVIIVKPGERVPLDGLVTGGESTLDTAALTGESMPRYVRAGDEVLSGSVNISGLLQLQVSREFAQATVSKILALMKEAGSRKARTEQFITKFARWYTPAVVAVAAALAVIPPLLLPGAAFFDWLYRALVFLAVSCPCALVASIPLGFFGGLGGASRSGILIKGSNYLEALHNVTWAVFDKTGTLTKGVSTVTSVVPAPGYTREQVLEAAAWAEAYSNHPIARSILTAYGQEIPRERINSFTELPGRGVQVETAGHTILAGTDRLMRENGVMWQWQEAPGTVVHVAIDGQYAGHVVIADELKADAASALQDLKKLGVKHLVMMTGDRQAVAAQVAEQLPLDGYYAELLPQDKVARIEEIVRHKGKGTLVFVGDGINDAPVLARADVGVAMGGLGADAAIEAADVTIMTDEPASLGTAIRIARRTRWIVWQNIALALSIKGLVLVLGAFGMATLWQAVIADVGVAVVAILNSMRVLWTGAVPQKGESPGLAVARQL